MNKFFTIIIPTYNSKKLEFGLKSIESQSIKDEIEVIIVDDNSSDKEYFKLLNNFTFDYKIIENKENLGPGGARQVGIDAAQGQWITFLDHDDAFSPDCFTLIKNEIINSNCKALFQTSSLVAKDFTFTKTGEYTISEKDTWLHGRFFNKKYLQRNGIRFHTKLIAQEDIYFCALVTNIIALDPNYSDELIVSSPIVSYYWFLWEDSTSHLEYEQKNYIVYYFKDFITSNYDVYRFCYNLYPSEEYKRRKLTSTFIYCYLYYEKFRSEYKNTNKDISHMLKHTKDFKNIIFKELNIDNDGLINLLYNKKDCAEIFVEAFMKVNECYGDFFIPEVSIKDFVYLLDK